MCLYISQRVLSRHGQPLSAPSTPAASATDTAQVRRSARSKPAASSVVSGYTKCLEDYQSSISKHLDETRNVCLPYQMIFCILSQSCGNSHLEVLVGSSVHWIVSARSMCTEDIQKNSVVALILFPPDLVLQFHAVLFTIFLALVLSCHVLFSLCDFPLKLLPFGCIHSLICVCFKIIPAPFLMRRIKNRFGWKTLPLS